MQSLVKTFKALSDPGRIRILRMLEVKPLCVCEITEVLGLAVSTVSRHLSILKDAGFISDKKEQKWVEYRLIEHTEPNLNSELLVLLGRESDKNDIGMKEKLQAGKVDRNILCGPDKNRSKE